MLKSSKGNFMNTSRQRILAHLKKTRSASARELARALKLSAPNVRHHLAVLCSDGRVEMTGLHTRGEKGRPEKVYSLAQAAIGDNLSALVKALLAEAGPKVRMEAVARHLLDAGQFTSLPIAKRLGLLLDKLNEMHYDARWEAGSEGPRVMFGRCPYAKVIDDHPELCKMDLAVLGMALGRPVTFAQKPQLAHGLCPFIFQMG
jgi:predicted ArsR family transcriptional regulator